MPRPSRRRLAIGSASRQMSIPLLTDKVPLRVMPVVPLDETADSRMFIDVLDRRPFH
jgi:hypothetical protein